MKNRILVLALAILAGTVSLSSCGKYNYNKEVKKQDMEANPRIYGEVGGPAKHSKNEYPTDPEATAKAAVIKSLLFDENARAKGVDTAKAVASTKE